MRTTDRLTVSLALLVATLGGASWAQTSAPSTRPSTRPGKEEVLAILDRQEKKGAEVRDIKATVRHEMNEIVVGNRDQKFGTLELVRMGKGDLRFRVEFDRRKLGRITRKIWHLYIYDGEYFIQAKESERTVIKRQIRRKGEPPNDLLGIDGPFPVPFGQKTGEILKVYSVTKISPKKKDPRDVLELVPRKGTKQARDCDKVLLYIDKKLGLPTRIVIYEKDSETILTYDFDDIRINKGVDKSRFQYKPPGTWEIQVQPLDPERK